jgi:transposase
MSWDHLPLYRQSQIFARQGVELDRSTLANWVGGAVWWLEPLQARLAEHVFASQKLFADDTPIPVLDPGRGRTKTGRIWVYARDDRPWSGSDPPAAVYLYSPDRRTERPASHPRRRMSSRAGRRKRYRRASRCSIR